MDFTSFYFFKIIKVMKITTHNIKGKNMLNKELFNLVVL